MRFIYHHRTGGRGGEGVHIVSVVQALRQAGHQVEIVSPPGVDPERTATTVPLDKGAQDASGVQRLWKWVSCSCPQVVFELAELAYNAYAAARLLPRLWGKAPAVYYGRHAFFLCTGIFLAKWCGKPAMLEVNEVAGIPRARAQQWVRLARWLERKTFERADEIFTVSSFLQREVLALGGRPGHVHVVPNAIDPSRFTPGKGAAAVRARYGLGAGPVIGFVGWFDRWDRIDRFVDLLSALRPRYPDVRLLLVGDGQVAGELRAALKKAGLDGLATFTGPVARRDVPDHIDAMDVCILADATEFCSPLVLFEFMAMGKPVIAPDVEPIREVLVHGETGWIVERDSALALQEASLRLFDDPLLARRIGEAARRRALEHHTWAAIAAKIGALAVERLQPSGDGMTRQPGFRLAGNRPWPVVPSVAAFLRNLHLW